MYSPFSHIIFIMSSSYPIVSHSFAIKLHRMATYDKIRVTINYLLPLEYPTPRFYHIPSGNLLLFAIEHGPVEIVDDYPVKMVIYPVKTVIFNRKQLVYQRVIPISLDLNHRHSSQSPSLSPAGLAGSAARTGAVTHGPSWQWLERDDDEIDWTPGGFFWPKNISGEDVSDTVCLVVWNHGFFYNFPY